MTIKDSHDKTNILKFVSNEMPDIERIYMCGHKWMQEIAITDQDGIPSTHQCARL